VLLKYYFPNFDTIAIFVYYLPI